jgi:glycosyltransferase involved in cell wall biosynthesis
MTVSVIIPNFNHAKYLKQRIDTILNQTYRDFELIILDDNSTDNSRDIIDEYIHRFPDIRSFYNKTNSGSPFTQWNLGVENAKGEFIWIAESDDFADTRFLEKATELMLRNEKMGLVYCDAFVIDEKNNTEYRASKLRTNLHNKKWLNNYINSGKDEISDFLYKNNTINNVSGVLFRKNKFIEAGKADFKMKFCGDWFLYIRILLVSDIGYICEPLNTYRLHPNSSYNSYFSSNTFLSEVFRIYMFLIKNVRLSPKKYLIMLSNLFMTLLRRIARIIGIKKP